MTLDELQYFLSFHNIFDIEVTSYIKEGTILLALDISKHRENIQAFIRDTNFPIGLRILFVNKSGINGFGYFKDTTRQNKKYYEIWELQNFYNSIDFITSEEDVV